MRWLTRCLAVAATLALLVALLPAASAEMLLGLRDLDCSGVTVSGTGLPASTDVSVTLLDGVHLRELVRQSITIGASGSFTWRTRVSLGGLRSVRAVVTRPGTAAPIAWAEHVVPSACPLAHTGSGHVLPMVGLSLSSIAFGFLLLTAFAYKGRHVGLYQGRHLAVRCGGNP